MSDFNKDRLTNVLTHLYKTGVNEMPLKYKPSKDDLNTFKQAVQDVSLSEQITEETFDKADMYDQSVSHFLCTVGERLGVPVHETRVSLLTLSLADISAKANTNEEPGSWFPRGFESVYNEPFDHATQLASFNHDFDDTELDDMVKAFEADYGKDGRNRPIDVRKKEASDNTSQILGSLNNGSRENDLFGVSLSKEADLSKVPVKLTDLQDVKETDSGLEMQSDLKDVLSFIKESGVYSNGVLSEPYYGPERNNSEYVENLQKFNENVRDVAKRWDVSDSDLITSVDYFEAFVSESVKLTSLQKSEINPELEPLSTADSFGVVRDVLLNENQEYKHKDLHAFLSGYANVYREPVDAYASTFGEVQESLDSYGLGKRAVNPRIEAMSYESFMSYGQDELNTLFEEIEKEETKELKKQTVYPEHEDELSM